MRRLVAFGPVTALVLFGACGGSIDGTIPEGDAGLRDAGTDTRISDPSRRDSSAPPNDSGATDTGATDAGTSGPFAKLLLVNATTDLGPSAAIGASAAFRLCFEQGTTQPTLSVAPYPPLPDKQPVGQTDPAGIYHGAGALLPSFGLDLENRIIRPIVMNAKTLMAKGFVNPGNGSLGTTCDELVGATKKPGTGLVENTDYWQLPAIPAGTFRKQRSYVLALMGCVKDAAVANTAKCGAGFPGGGAPGVGNLAVRIVEVTRTPVGAASLGVHFFHASPQASAVLGAQGVKPGFVTDPTSGAGFRLAVPAAGVTTGSISPVQAIAGVTDSDSFVLAASDPAAPPQSLLPSTLPENQARSGLGTAAAPTVYTPGKNFVFLGVGDPELPDGDPKAFHFLAFPTDPVIVPYSP